MIITHLSKLSLLLLLLLCLVMNGSVANPRDNFVQCVDAFAKFADLICSEMMINDGAGLI